MAWKKCAKSGLSGQVLCGLYFSNVNCTFECVYYGHSSAIFQDLLLDWSILYQKFVPSNSPTISTSTFSTLLEKDPPAQFLSSPSGMQKRKNLKREKTLWVVFLLNDWRQNFLDRLTNWRVDRCEGWNSTIDNILLTRSPKINCEGKKCFTSKVFKAGVCM